MLSVINRWGNDLAVRIPARVAKEINLEEGEKVNVSVARGKIVIAPAQPQPTLDELLDKITPQNHHDMISFGEPRGKEVW